MAEIITDPKHDKGRASAYLLGDTACGQDYIFLVHGNHIEIEPAHRDWRKDLTEQEKLDLFDRILNDFREERTVGDDGFKIASLGVTTDGRLYIAGNVGETQNSSPFHRGCAETRMLHISAERDAYEQSSARRHAKSSNEEYTPRFLEYDEVYVKGGQAPGTPIVAPCGDCTETLAKHMAPQARVIMLPVETEGKKLTFNTRAKFARELGADEAWGTTIGYLRPLHEIPLKAEVADQQRQAFDGMARQFAQLLAAGKPYVPAVPFPETATKPQVGDATAKLLQKQSVPPAPSLAQVNEWQHDQIKAAAFDRLQTALEQAGDRDYSPAHLKEVLAATIKNIRAVVIQLDNGKLYSGLAAAGRLDKAGVTAEMQAIGNANRDLGSQGILRVLSVELAPAKIEQGLLRTSHKASIERTVKRRSHITNTTEFTYAPFNGGGLGEAQLSRIARRHMAEELSPGYFTGKASQRAADPLIAAYTPGVSGAAGR